MFCFISGDYDDDHEDDDHDHDDDHDDHDDGGCSKRRQQQAQIGQPPAGSVKFGQLRTHPAILANLPLPLSDCPPPGGRTWPPALGARGERPVHRSAGHAQALAPAAEHRSAQLVSLLARPELAWPGKIFGSSRWPRSTGRECLSIRQAGSRE